MDTGKIILLIFVVLAAYFLWRKFAKPAAITHDSTLLFTGGLGSGKSLNSVKFAIKSYKRVHRSWWLTCKWMDIKAKLFNRRYEYPEEPGLYSNIPIRIGIFKKRWCCMLTRDHLTLKKRIPTGSVVLIDELPQFVNQFEWDNKLVQGDLNEMITFFRHYVDGLLICNAQSLDEVECHVRRKLNAYYYCFDFQPIFGIFYRCHLLKCRIGDASVSLTNDYIDENAKWHYGLLLPRRYDSRCYSERYNKVVETKDIPFKDYKTNRILRFDPDRKSPLDDEED